MEPDYVKFDPNNLSTYPVAVDESTSINVYLYLRNGKRVVGYFGNFYPAYFLGETAKKAAEDIKFSDTSKQFFCRWKDVVGWKYIRPQDEVKGYPRTILPLAVDPDGYLHTLSRYKPIDEIQEGDE